VGLRRFLGLGGPAAADGAPTRSADPAPTRGSEAAADTATVRRIVAELSAMPPEQSRYLAGFAYVLSRAAHADLEISDDETRLMERFVIENGGLPEPQAVLAVEIAKSQSRLYGGTEDYLVTREFAKSATEEQRLAVVRCCFAIGAADESITAEENTEIREIAFELGLTRDQLNAIANEFRDKLSVIQSMRRSRLGPSDSDDATGPTEPPAAG
jgi:uncharacterized tellurite resistance protein B-like protein